MLETIEKQDNKIDRQAQNYNFSYRAINYFKSEIETLFTDIRKAQEQGKNIYVVVATKEKAKKLKEILEKEDIIWIEGRIEEKEIVIKELIKIQVKVNRIGHKAYSTTNHVYIFLAHFKSIN